MKNNGNKKRNIRWTLVLYDIVIYLVVAALLLVLYGGNDKLATVTVIQQMLLSAICVFAARLIGNVYGQVWRDSVLHQAIVYRCDCILGICITGIDTSGSQDYLCKNAGVVLHERSGSAYSSYDVPLRLQMRQSGNFVWQISGETSLSRIRCTGGK